MEGRGKINIIRRNEKGEKRIKTFLNVKSHCYKTNHTLGLSSSVYFIKCYHAQCGINKSAQ